MTPDKHPTLEEWIAATQSCCGVDHDDDVEAEVPKDATDEQKPLGTERISSTPLVLPG